MPVLEEGNLSKALIYFNSYFFTIGSDAGGLFLCFEIFFSFFWKSPPTRTASKSPNSVLGYENSKRVLELCVENNIEYEYYNNEFGFRFSFHRNNVTINVTKNVTSDVTTEVPKKVNELDFKVLHLLKENPVYTREEIAQKVGKTARTVQRALDRLKEDGKIVRIGNKVSGYWEVIE